MDLSPSAGETHNTSAWAQIKLFEISFKLWSATFKFLVFFLFYFFCVDSFLPCQNFCKDIFFKLSEMTWKCLSGSFDKSWSVSFRVGHTVLAFMKGTA